MSGAGDGPHRDGMDFCRLWTEETGNMPSVPTGVPILRGYEWTGVEIMEGVIRS